MRTLVVTCGGGLGNRLLGLASAMVLARRHGVELKAYWPLGIPKQTGTSEGFYGDLCQLYLPPCEMLTELEFNRIMSQPRRHYSLEDHKLGYTLADEGVTYFYTHGAIRDAASPVELQKVLLELHPTPAVRDCLCTARTLMDGYSYHGLLVRCHGHPKARRWNPAVKFKLFLQRQSESCFYLCCDSHDATGRLMAAGRGRHRFVTLPRKWRLNSAEELVTVAADLRMLSECNDFYATPFCAMTRLVNVLRGRDECYYPE